MCMCMCVYVLLCGWGHHKYYLPLTYCYCALSPPSTNNQANKGSQQLFHQDKHRSMLLALQDSTPLIVVRGGEAYVLLLNAGEAFYFGRDVVHAGAAHAEDNIRLHWYMLKAGEEADAGTRPSGMTKVAQGDMHELVLERHHLCR